MSLLKHKHFFAKTYRVEERIGPIAAHELIHHHGDILPAASDLQIMPLKVVQQAAALGQRLANILDSRAQIDARVYGAVAQLYRHVVVVLGALGVEEQRVGLVGPEAEQQLVLIAVQRLHARVIGRERQLVEGDGGRLVLTAVELEPQGDEVVPLEGVEADVAGDDRLQQVVLHNMSDKK